MKKIALVLITAVTCLSAYSQMKPVTPNNKLDGKTFNITLTEKKDEAKSLNTTSSMNNPNQMNPAANQGSLNETTTTATSGQGSTSTATTGSKDVLGTNPTTDVKNNNNTQTQSTVTTQSGSTSTSTTNDINDKNAELQGIEQEDMKGGKSPQTVTTPQATTAPPDNSKANNANADYSIYTQPMATNKTTISFNSGALESVLLTERNLESCPYNINANEADMSLFSSVCRSASPEATAVWSGFVDGNSVKGDVSFRLGNGEVKSYSFTGVAVPAKKVSKSKTSSSIEAPVKGSN